MSIIFRYNYVSIKIISHDGGIVARHNIDNYHYTYTHFMVNVQLLGLIQLAIANNSFHRLATIAS